MKKNAWIVSAIILSSSLPIYAASVSDMARQEQLQQAREADAARNDRLRRPTVSMEGVTTNVNPSIAPGGSSFFIREIQLDGMTDEFSFLNQYLKGKDHHHLDVAVINSMVQQMNQALLDKGYATSQVSIPEQNLGNGVLHLMLQLGRIHAVTYSEGSPPVPWRTAFPIGEGDVVKVPLLEQGLEQMKSLSSQDVMMKLVPSNVPGQSDVELTIKRTKPVHFVVSADDSGLSSTGRLQLSMDMSIDNPFVANDVLHIGINGDGAQDGYQKGTRGHSFYYRIPYGKDTFSVSYNKYEYHQTVPSYPYNFISKGKSNTSTLTWNHVMSRNQNSKTSFDVSVTKRNSHQYINDLEIPVQQMHTTSVEAGIAKQRYSGADTWYLRLGHRMGLGWFGAMPENLYEDGPKSRYHMWLFDVDYQHPFTMGHRPASYTASFHGQWMMKGDRLYGVDDISMGNRYTVRGFDGEMTFMSESGWYWRNEVSSYIPDLQSSLYVGLDFGAVYGPSTEDLLGKFIAGTVIGLRGDISSGLSYDVFAGIPVYKPQGYHTDKVTSGFTCSWRF